MIRTTEGTERLGSGVLGFKLGFRILGFRSFVEGCGHLSRILELRGLEGLGFQVVKGF